MGKSLYVRKMAQKYSKANPAVLSIPVHGPSVTSDGLMKQLWQTVANYSNGIIHLDIASTVSSLLPCRVFFKVSEFHVVITTKVLAQVDTLLFKLLVLRGLSDSIGRVWRCYQSQIYLVEITLENSAEVCMWGIVFFFMYPIIRKLVDLVW